MKAAKVADGACSQKCVNDPSQTCGDNGYATVYKLDKRFNSRISVRFGVK
jgi:hypothetical protein